MTVVATAVAEVGAAVDFTEGSMVCLYLDPATAAALAVPGGQEPETLHVTLAFLPNGVQDPEQLTPILALLAEWFDPLDGVLGGFGMFAPGPDGVPVIGLPDVPGLDELRVAVVEALEEAGVDVAHNHGFQPHVTLAYGDTEIDPSVLGTQLAFDHLSLQVGVERWDFPFGGALMAADYPPEQGGHPHGYGLGPAYKMREDQVVGRPGGVAQVRRPFDPSKHPHEPAGSSKGGQWAATLGLTPFRPGDTAAGFYDSPKFKAFDRSVSETAKRYDVTIDAKDRVQGFWEGEQEPSLALDVHDGEEGVRMYAEDLRGQWDQDAVLLFQPDRNGDQLSFRAQAKGDIPKALTDAGISGATIYPQGFEVYGDAGDAEKVLKAADALGVPHSEVKVRAGHLTFAERPVH